MKKFLKVFICTCIVMIALITTCFANEGTPLSKQMLESVRKVAMEYVIFEKNASTELVSSNNKEFSWEKTLFVGDSLLKGLDNTNKIQDMGATVNAKVGRPISKGKEVLKEYSGFDTVVIILGTNDCRNNKKTFKKYAENAIQTAKENNPNANIFITTMAPIDNAKASKNGYKATNSMVENNNKTIKEVAKEENINLLDSYEFLTNNGYSTRDGIHMQSSTYEAWFNWMKDKINI